MDTCPGAPSEVLHVADHAGRAEGWRRYSAVTHATPRVGWGLITGLALSAVWCFQTGGGWLPSADASEVRSAAPPPAPLPRPTPSFDLAKLARQVHFSYRSRATGGFTGGDSTYAVQVDQDGGFIFQPMEPKHERSARAATRVAPDRDLRGSSAREVVTAAPARFTTVEIGGALDRSKVALRSDGGVRITRGAVVESLHNGEDGVEQSWTFERRPARAGDVLVRLAVSGQRYRGETKRGLHFVDPDSRLGVRYGVATWVDATGRRTEVRPRYEGGEILLRVPAAVVASSSFPAVLDPLLSPEQGTDDPVISPVVGGTASPTIAWDGTHYLIVWSDCRDACGIWAARVDPSDGHLVDPTGVPIAFNDGYNNFFNFTSPQGVACDATQCLIIWTASPSPLLKGRFFIKATPDTPSATFTITSLPPDNWQGGTVAFNGTEYLVAYSLLGPNFNPVVGNIVHPDGTVDAQFTIEPSCASGIVAPRTAACASQHRNPVVASDGASFYVVWNEQDLNTSANQWFTLIFGRGVSADGVPQGTGAAPVTPITETWNHQALFTQPSVAWDGTGNYVVAWDDTRACPGTPPLTNCSDTRIYARQVSAVFVPAVAELELTTDVAARQQFVPTLARSSPSNLLVTWNDGRGGIWGGRITSGPLALNGGNLSVVGGSNSSVASDGNNYAVAASNNSEAYVAGVTSSGGSQFAAERVSNSANAQVSPALAFDGTNVLAVWSDSRDSPSQHHIYGARIAANGTVLDTGGIAVSTTDDEGSPAVAFASATSSYLVVWTTGSGVRARRVNIDGQTPCCEQSISVPGASPSVASDGTNFLIVGSVPPSDSPGSIAAVLVGPDATPSTGVSISTTTAPDAHTAVGYSPTTGRYLVVWGEGGDLRGRLVGTDGIPLGGSTGFVITNAIGQQGEPSVTFDGANFVVAWSDRRSGTFSDIYAARVTTDGAVLDVSGVPVSPLGGEDKTSPKVAFDGADTIVTWLESASGDLVATRVTVDLGAVLDNPPLVIATGEAIASPALTADGSGRTLIAYARFDPTTGLATFRVYRRFLISDTTPPVLTVPTSITVNATSAAGAVVTYTATATDNVDGTLPVSCSPPSGSLFPIGTTTVHCSAMDAAGNPASASFPVNVTGAATQLTSLISLVNSLGLASGLTNSLVVKLQAALTAINTGQTATACGKLNDFISAVKAQTGKGITPTQASQLIAGAVGIKGAIGCS